MAVKLKSKKKSRTQRENNTKNTKSKRKRRFQSKRSIKKVGGDIIPKTLQIPNHQLNFRQHLLILIQFCISKLGDGKEWRKLIRECDKEVEKKIKETDTNELHKFCIEFLTGQLKTLPNEIKRIPYDLREKETKKRINGIKREITIKHLKSDTLKEDYASKAQNTSGGGDFDNDFHIILSLLANLWRALLKPDKKRYENNKRMGKKNLFTTYHASEYLSKNFKNNITDIASISRDWCKKMFTAANQNNQDETQAETQNGLNNTTENVLYYIGSMWFDFHSDGEKISRLKKINALIKYDEDKFVFPPVENSIAPQFPAGLDDKL